MTAGRSELVDSIEAACARRASLVADLTSSGTDCYRLFHGTVEGRPGLTIDRYGRCALIQSFHVPLTAEELAEVEAHLRATHPEITEVVYNDRSERHSRVRNADAIESSREPDVVHELGVAYEFQARHRGQDPWLFLDLRVARRYVQRVAAGKSVLNLFAYTCGVGTCAAAAGATRVLNVDFARSSLEVGQRNALRNGVADTSAFFESDFFPAVRQLSGLGLARPRRHERERVAPVIAPETFDLVFLDPPRYAKSAFGVVDLVNDYGGVFKPSLLATREGGTLVCCNNVARVDVHAWVESLERGARKHGRTVRSLELLRVEDDFPTRDENPPLKIAVLSV